MCQKPENLSEYYESDISNSTKIWQNTHDIEYSAITDEHVI